MLAYVLSNLIGQLVPPIFAGVGQDQSQIVTVEPLRPPIFQPHPQEQRMPRGRDGTHLTDSEPPNVDIILAQVAGADHPNKGEVVKRNFGVADRTASPYEHTETEKNLRSGGLAEVFESKMKLAFARKRGVIAPRRFDKGDVRAELPGRRLSGYNIGFLSVLSGPTRPLGGTPGGGESQSAKEDAKRSEQPSGVRPAASSISSLPLSAKIGSTFVLAFLAWLVQVRGFTLLTQGRGYRFEGGAYLVAGSVWLLALIGLWWASAG